MHYHVGRVMLCSLLPAMSGQFEVYAQRPGNGSCWCEHGQGDQTSFGWTDSKSLTVVCFCSSTPVFFRFVCGCADICACVCLFCRFEKSASNLDLPKPPSRRKKTLPRCSAPKGQPNVAFGLVLSTEISVHFKMASNEWLMFLASNIPQTTLDAKTLMGLMGVSELQNLRHNIITHKLWFKLLNQSLSTLIQRLVGSLRNTAYISHQCVYDVFLMWLVVGCSLHTSFNTGFSQCWLQENSGQIA